jgi:hypothetical protein
MIMLPVSTTLAQRRGASVEELQLRRINVVHRHILHNSFWTTAITLNRNGVMHIEAASPGSEAAEFSNLLVKDAHSGWIKTDQPQRLVFCPLSTDFLPASSRKV